jgi:hypothetical protein
MKPMNKSQRENSWEKEWDKLFDEFVVSRGDVLLHTQLAGLVRRKKRAFVEVSSSADE